jgi:hypothetical protein
MEGNEIMKFQKKRREIELELNEKKREKEEVGKKKELDREKK